MYEAGLSISSPDVIASNFAGTLNNPFGVAWWNASKEFGTADSEWGKSVDEYLEQRAHGVSDDYSWIDEYRRRIASIVNQ